MYSHQHSPGLVRYALEISDTKGSTRNVETTSAVYRPARYKRDVVPTAFDPAYFSYEFRVERNSKPETRNLLNDHLLNDTDPVIGI